MIKKLNNNFRIGSFNNIEINDLILINNEVCKIVEISYTNPGKHGAMKGQILGISVFDNKEHILICSINTQIKIPKVNYTNHKLLNIRKEINDGIPIYYIGLLTEKDIEMLNIKMNENKIINEINENYQNNKTIYVTTIEYENIMSIYSYTLNLCVGDHNMITLHYNVIMLCNHKFIK